MVNWRLLKSWNHVDKTDSFRLWHYFTVQYPVFPCSFPSLLSFLISKIITQILCDHSFDKTRFSCWCHTQSFSFRVLFGTYIFTKCFGRGWSTPLFFAPTSLYRTSTHSVHTEPPRASYTGNYCLQHDLAHSALVRAELLIRFCFVHLLNTYKYPVMVYGRPA